MNIAPWIFQLFQGVTFVLFYSAGIQYLYRIVPEEWRSTGQTALAVCFFGLSGVIGSFVGGRVLEHYGGSLLYTGMSGIAALFIDAVERGKQSV